FEEDVAEHEEEGPVDVAFQLADGMGQAKALLLFHIAYADTVGGAVAEGPGDDVAEMADDDDDVFNAEAAEVFQLVDEEGLVADGCDGLGDFLAEGAHAGSVAGGEYDADVAI